MVECMDAKILELRQTAWKQALLGFLRQEQFLLALLLLRQGLKSNHLSGGFEFPYRLLQHPAMIRGPQVQQTHLQNVADPRPELGQIERLADEVLGAGCERA